MQVLQPQQTESVAGAAAPNYVDPEFRRSGWQPPTPPWILGWPKEYGGMFG